MSNKAQKIAQILRGQDSSLEEILGKISQLKGEPGYSPVKGQDYFTEEEIEALKAEVTPTKGRDYFDGLDGEPGPQGPIGPKGERGFTGEPGESIVGRAGRDGKDGTLITSVEIREKLTSLVGDDRLDVSAIKGIMVPEDFVNYFEKLDQGIKNRVIGTSNFLSRKGPIDQRFHGGGSSSTISVADTSTVDLTLTGTTLTAAVIKQMSITSDGSGLKLSGDATSPGNSKYYGTDGAGTKGYFSLPAGTPGGPDQSIQFNNAGAFDGDSELTWDTVNKIFQVTDSGLVATFLIDPANQKYQIGQLSDTYIQIDGITNIITYNANSSHMFSGNVESNGVFTSGSGGSVAGQYNMLGSTSGSVSIRAGTTPNGWNMTLPLNAGTNNYVLTTNGAGITSWTNPTTLVGPGGSNTQIQFNDSSAFGGDADFTWNKTTNVLTITGTATVSGAIRSNTSLILEDPGAGTNTVTIQSPTLAGSWTMTLPTTDGNANQFLQTDGNGVTTWATGGAGDVVGPASATDNAVSRFDGTTGKLIQNSGVIIDDSNNVTGVNTIAVVATTNQLILGTTRTATITAPTPATTSRVYTIPDPGADASFVMTELAQTLNAIKTFTSAPLMKLGVNLEDPGAGTNTITVLAPTLGASYNMTLPTTGGTVNYKRATDGTGVESWVKDTEGEYGTGLDGNLNNAGTITLTSDMHYADLTNTGTIHTAGYRIFVSGTLSGNGTIDNLGAPAVGPAPGAGGAIGSTGGGGQGGAAGAGGTNVTTAIGGAGGAGGGGAAGGIATAPAEANGGIRAAYALPTAISARDLKPNLFTGGGGGGGGTAAVPGAGGGGGGVVVLATYTTTFTGTVSANGGNGAAGAPPGGDGGGGGGGGTVIWIYKYGTPSASATVTANGGALGPKFGAGANGVAGTNGRTIFIQN